MALAQDSEPDAEAQFMWTTESIQLKRFQDEEGNSADVDAGKRVEVVVIDEDSVRIRSDIHFGWTTLDKLTETSPNQASPAPPIQFQVGSPDGPGQ